MILKHIIFIVGALGAFALVTGCSSDTSVGSSQAALEPSCIEDASELEPEEWLCPNAFTVECEDGVGDPETIYIEPADDLAETACDNIDLYYFTAVVQDDDGNLSDPCLLTRVE